MTAKAIAKKIKAKGLGRLRWYCQMCEKQCRDENGFQCHMRSESHKRLLAVFADAPQEFIEKFSDNFRREFLTVVRQRYGTNAVQANTAYQDYIKDRHHLHMNATRWTTLTEFVKELGRTAHCRVEERDDGWWISVIDRRAAERSREAHELNRARLAEEERNELVLQYQMRMAAAHIPDAPRESEEEVPANATNFDEPVKLNAKPARSVVNKEGGEGGNVFDGLSKRTLDDGEAEKPAGPKKKKRSRWGPATKLSALEEIMLTQQTARKRASVAHHDNDGSKTQQGTGNGPHNAVGGKGVPEDERAWVMKGIAVKVMNQALGGGAYYRKKGEVTDVIDEFGARVRLCETRTVVELDQDDLETVIPKPGGSVVLLEGKYRGRRATLLEIDESSFSVSVRLEGSDKVLNKVEYEHVSRSA